MSQPEIAIIQVVRNGPYKLSGKIKISMQTIGIDHAGYSLRWIEGRSFDYKNNNVFLCRCGASSHKPFCDGSHTKIGFDGTETATSATFRAQMKVYDGPVEQLGDQEALCAYARFCDRHGRVWNQAGQSDKPEIRASLEEQVGQCAAGRLVVWNKATGEVIEPKFELSIGIVEDPAQGCSGPLWLRGGIQVTSADGRAYEIRNRATLCRCGLSANKPFCDGTHASEKFQDDIEPRSR